MDGNAITPAVVDLRFDALIGRAVLQAYARNASNRVTYPEDVLTPFEAFLSWADDVGLLTEVTLDAGDLGTQAEQRAWSEWDRQWDALAAHEVR